jgi:cytoplasmic tRNA 2-thiolation protein 2
MHSLRKVIVAPAFSSILLIYIHLIRPAQRHVQEWKEKISIRSYSDASSPAAFRGIPVTHLLHEANLISNSTPDDVCGPISPHSLTPYLCYACHTTLTSRSSRGSTATSPTGPDSASDAPLPMWVRHNLAHANSHAPCNGFQVDEPSSGVKLSREDMRALIGDSLIN